MVFLEKNHNSEAFEKSIYTNRMPVRYQEIPCLKGESGLHKDIVFPEEHMNFKIFPDNFLIPHAGAISRNTMYERSKTNFRQ